MVSFVGEAGGEVEVFTMLGLLQTLLPDTLGVELYDHLMELEDEVFCWPVRGPRIFRQIVDGLPLLRDDGDGCASRPDIVALTEYDVIHER
eukprot:CAMPEP_0194523478 /NCGR_PEP_ID=MMETSP0253-20130528/58381_1 /TAXON_ID=2966 /ORGANISM="Noctiluca scintillans" /LENGTH=90 /DNA_ID=CAMNT_0039368021 /DNA_START=17 /DNA_END=286 /DNA_ORIENTATION=-